MAKIGYARVSTRDQKLDSQIDSLEQYGCERIFSEKVSGRKQKRSELEKCLDYLRSGDTLVIYKLDRLGRTTKQLIELSQWLEDNNIELEIINMNLNTKDAMGKMFFTMMSAFAELEANLLSERTKKGLEAARARGRKGGRPPIPDRIQRQIIFMYNEEKLTYQQIANEFNISKMSVYRIIKKHKESGSVAKLEK
ncbi:recombinase family protein [Staphylococcus chromogenes]|uniref:recombinase family protein n=1 Tax=Staphylococcus chromogenes TaxID=46126 RepID=UPI002885E40D|nr:recombinase family protein [Staphylococcus chromogenes]MDT0656342.1 recombinase family protein [Staphylococcus chromogenes]MDT0672754.1 recombinase family protein [Staphylococcus chromogenes]MDT0674930.1 recombinase family protein [Staphylococcus chromogenes]MDT0699124.1 recombinase family protein [Staphylococcus chromogenes]